MKLKSRKINQKQFCRKNLRSSRRYQPGTSKKKNKKNIVLVEKKLQKFNQNTKQKYLMLPAKKNQTKKVTNKNIKYQSIQCNQIYQNQKLISSQSSEPMLLSIKKQEPQERKKILQNIILKCEKVYRETEKPKYFSKNLLNKIDQNCNGFNLKQDQKKSLQSNLIYSILKYLKWDKIVTFLKKNRSKVKILKVSTFQDHVLKGKLFEKQQNTQKFQVTAEMIQKAVFQFENIKKLYDNICQKKAYIKLYQDNVEIFKEKMILFVYKIIQFTESLKNYYNKNYKSSKESEDFIEDIFNQPKFQQKKYFQQQNPTNYKQTIYSYNSYNNQLNLQSNLYPMEPIPLTKQQNQQFFFSKMQQTTGSFNQQSEKKHHLSIKLDEIFNEDIDQDMSQNIYRVQQKQLYQKK